MRDFGTRIRRPVRHIWIMLSLHDLLRERVTHSASTTRTVGALRGVTRSTARNIGRGPLRAILLSCSVPIPQPLTGSPGFQKNVATSPRLIAADSALMLVERWKAELSVLRRRSPGSDAVRTLADCVEELSAAITAGHEVTIQLTVNEAHAMSHIPVSTLRWLCNHRPVVIGARKREGVWYVDRALFERYLVSPGDSRRGLSANIVQARTSHELVMPRGYEACPDLESEQQ